MDKPSIRRERAMLRAGAHRICGMDEVGRGAVAGPVAVGVVVVDRSTTTAPQGLKDSKLLRPALRVAMVPRLRSWCAESAVGYSEAHEIDEFGLIAALRLAGLRALSQIAPVDHIILDGNHNWMAHPEREVGRAQELERAASSTISGSAAVHQTNAPLTNAPSTPDPPIVATTAIDQTSSPPVTTIIGGDRLCSSVAAASVIAKVDRDARMIDLDNEFPRFGWGVNKGYGTALHMQAIRELGVCREHRQSWNLPPVSSAGRA